MKRSRAIDVSPVLLDKCSDKPLSFELDQSRQTMKDEGFGCFWTDHRSLLSELKQQEQMLQLKRRFVMGVQMSKSEEKILSKAKCVPESLLREDDIFYDDVKAYVEAAFGQGHHAQNEFETQLLNMNNMKEIVMCCLDSLTSKGLYLLSMFLTKGLPKAEKTRKKLREEIKKSIPGFLRDQRSNPEKLETLRQLSQLLSDRENIRLDCCTDAFQRQIAAFQMLCRLKDLPTEALFAMRRKLRGIPAELPHLPKRRHGWSRDTLIHKIKKTSRKMLSELGTDWRNGLHEPLAKSLAVAGLSLKLKRCPDYYMTEFANFPQEVEMLQNEIIKAIWLLEAKVTMSELQSLQDLFDPSGTVSKRSLRTFMKKLLAEYLFECDELDSIPQELLKALAIINKSSRVSPDKYSNRIIDEEIECILGVSSGIKQLVWDLTPDHVFDKDFADAYMEEQSDPEDDERDGISLLKPGSPSSRPAPMDSENDGESVAEYTPLECESGITEGCNSPCQTQEAESHPGTDSVLDNQIPRNNMYLEIQEAADEASMVSYNLIGHLLEALARGERLDLDSNHDPEAGAIIVQAVENLLPSFPRSGMAKLKELIGT